MIAAFRYMSIFYMNIHDITVKSYVFRLLHA